jgi:hypothetical protein
MRLRVFFGNGFIPWQGENFHLSFRKEDFGMPKDIDLTVPFDGKFRFKIDFKKDLTSEKDGIQATSYTMGVVNILE